VAIAVPLPGPRADRARRAADVLRQQIHAGAYADGLPPENELASEFFVSRNTIREALTVFEKRSID
jgi:GntR family transcriptional regulator